MLRLNPRLAAFIAALALSVGCSSTGKPPPGDLPLPDPVAVDPSDPDLLGEMGAGVDSAVALYEFGDIAHFLSTRDSLMRVLERMAAVNPSLREQPEYIRLLGSIEDMDSLLTAPGFSAETDSLALASDAWPESENGGTDLLTVAPGDSAFPYLSNDRIDFWIRYFTGPGRERFARVLYRMELYRPVVEDILTEKGLPTDLIVVPVIESGFVMKARSRARAVGPWQFIAGTARIYGLRVNWWYDERHDIIASTYAASNYLTDLYGIWESWPLALAAYNCGEYRVARAVAHHRTDSFWKLDLPKQTERYVPKFLAALYIIREPEKYGFTIPDVEPIKFDEVTTRDAIDLKLIAECAGTSVDVLRELNPNLLQWATPPSMEIRVKVPLGSGEICRQKLDEIPPSERMTWRKHKIRSGETLSTIAGRYGTSISALKDLNGIRNAHRIRAGQYLIVPVPSADAEVASSSKPEYMTKRRNIDKEAIEKYAQKSVAPPGYKKTVYTVKDHDTLGEIAELYHTRASKIRLWNNLRYRSYIYPGQKLVIYVEPSFDLAKADASQAPFNQEAFVKRTYTVKKGDTIYSISKRFNVAMSDLLTWNNKSTSRIYPGQTLDIWEKK